MGQINFKTKGDEKNNVHPLRISSRGYVENRLAPVNLSGVVIPWSKELDDGTKSDYKLACSSGLEYFIASDPEWKNVFSWYSWEEVKVIGLLNTSNLTLIPQKVFPKGPTGERENVVDLLAWKSRETFKKIVKNVNELVLVPAAVLAVLVAA